MARVLIIWFSSQAWLAFTILDSHIQLGSRLSSWHFWREHEDFGSHVEIGIHQDIGSRTFPLVFMRSMARDVS
jgi:hypothetical protein